jgi:predicted metal-binding membrane protein
MTPVAAEPETLHIARKHGQPTVIALVTSAARRPVSHDPVSRWMPQTSVVALLGVAGLAWWRTVTDAHHMSSMVDGTAKVGRAMAFHAGPGSFTGMWITMMAAMMLPTIAALVAASLGGRRRPSSSATPVIGFSCGYLATWTLAGVVPFALLSNLGRIGHATLLLDRGGGIALLGAGVYQFTSWKRSSLGRSDRSSSTDRSAIEPTGLRAGLTQGGRCLGQSWALIALLLVVGIMNLAWMVSISVVCFIEGRWRHGGAVANLAGAALVGLGLAVLIQPQVLTAIAAAPRTGMHG